MRKSKELDHHLKHIIDGVPVKLEQFANGNSNKMVYYTGNWHTDVVNNYTEKQAEKIFKKMAKIHDKYPEIAFFQKRNQDIKIGTWSEYGERPEEIITSFDYIVLRKRG